MVQPIPDGYPRVTPYLCVDGAAAAIEFYGSVFGTTERMRLEGPDGTIGHAEIEVGGSVIMLSDPFEELGVHSPTTIGGSPVTMHLYVEDVDGVHARALAAGATELRPLTDQFYGDRSCLILDPFGHRWDLATHIEDMDPEEMARRAAEAMGG